MPILVIEAYALASPVAFGKNTAANSASDAKSSASANDHATYGAEYYELARTSRSDEDEIDDYESEHKKKREES